MWRETGSSLWVPAATRCPERRRGGLIDHPWNAAKEEQIRRVKKSKKC